MVTASKKQLEAARFYGQIMSEVKYRVRALEMLVNERTGLSPPFVREFSFLQLRMICELIALGCLTAHGDIPATQKRPLQRQWNAHEIMKQLGKLHSDFFPVPYVAKPTASGSAHLDEVDTTFSKTDLMALYAKCGLILHRGSVEKFMATRYPLEITYRDIIEATHNIQLLLNEHMVWMLGGKWLFICTMHSPPDNEVRVRIAATE